MSLEPESVAAAAPSSPMRPSWLRNVRGDLAGGVTAALVTVPLCMGFGLLGYSAMGPDYAPQAILAGLYASICGCLIAVLLGANTTMLYAPRSIVTVLIGVFLLHRLHVDSELLQVDPVGMLLLLALLLIFLAGLFQVLFGALGLGALVKYIPLPVMAGFQNAAALLIAFTQLDTLLGLPEHVPAIAIPFNLDLVQWPTAVVGGVTCILILQGERITRRVPAVIVGMVGGLATYYSFVLLGFGAALGPVVGKLPSAWPHPHFSDFGRLLADPRLWETAPTLLVSALSIAIVASLDTLLCARLVERETRCRFQPNAELVRLGVGNMFSASLGGIANGINIGSSLANFRSGGRTALSVALHAAALLLTVLLLAPLLGYVPLVIVAAILMVVALQLFDRWTLQILGRLWRREFSNIRSVLLDFVVIVVVTAAAIAMNIVLAVAIGITFTILFFIFRMSKSVIRRVYRCDVVHSRKTRNPQQMEILGHHGSRIMVVELAGPVFFGTAENLAAYIDAALSEETSYVIFDFKRVNEIDSTGAKVLLQTHDTLTKDGKYLLVSSLDETRVLAHVLKDMGVIAALTRNRIFSDTDRAIEWAEDHLLLAELGAGAPDAEFPFSQLDVFANLNENECEEIEAALLRKTYNKGDIVFNEGDDSRELYIIAKGSASVRLRLRGTDRETRLITFSPGTVFGELALLDRGARSATVEADGELVCYVLTDTSFDTLTERAPTVAIKLLTNLGRELSGRLRRANRTIYQLAS